MDVCAADLRDLVFFTFRYALGRRTYITSMAADYIIQYYEALDDNTRLQIVKEIHRAFETGAYGMEMDKAEWQRVLDFIGEKHAE